MKSPTQWEAYADAAGAVSATIEATVGEAGFLANLSYVENDNYFRDGEDWVGPGGGEQGELRARMMGPVSRQYTPVPVTAEAVGRVVNGLTKRQADLALVPLEPAPEGSPEAETQAAEAASIVADVAYWWDKKSLWPRTKDAVRSSTYSERGYMRPWIPDRVMVGGQDGKKRLPLGLSLRDALLNVEVSSPKSDAAVIYTDPESQTSAAVILYEEGESSVAEVWTTDGKIAFMRKLRERPGPGQLAIEKAVEVPLRGLLPLAEMRAELLVTESVRKQQQRLNYFESLLLRIVETAGFPERYVSNAKPNGIWVKTKPADRPALDTQEDTETGETWYLIPASRTLGAAITTELTGINGGTKEDPNLTTPSVTRFEPTDPEFAIKAAAHARATILRTCKQAHMLSDGSGQLSGIAYEQARADFEDDLENRKTALEQMLATLISVAIRYAELMGTPNAPSILDQYRVVVTVYVSAGPTSPERLKSADELRKAGLISRRTAMARVGVEDPSAELQDIESSWEEQIRFKKARAELLGMLKDLLPMYEAAIEAGYTEEEARRMAKVDAPYEEAPV